MSLWARSRGPMSLSGEEQSAPMSLSAKSRMHP